MQLDGLLGGTRAEFIGRRETKGPLLLCHHIRQLSVHQKHGEAQVEITVPTGRRKKISKEAEHNHPDKGFLGVTFTPSRRSSKFVAMEVRHDNSIGKAICNN